MRYAILLTLAILTLGHVPSLTGQEVDRMGALPPRIDRNGGPDLHTAEVDLFTKRDDDAGLTETQRAIKKASPVIQKAEGVVVVFGADWCTWCKRQAAHLKGPSQRYNIVVLPVDKSGPGRQIAFALDIVDKEGNPGASGIPVTVVLEKGEPVKTFLGFTPWDQIKPHAEKARKSDDDQKGRIDIGPIHIDWDLDGYDPDDTYDRQRRRR